MASRDDRDLFFQRLTRSSRAGFARGVYHWLEVGGADVTAGMPSGWEQNDLFELERRGFLERVLESHAPGDPEDVSITFRVSTRE